MLRAELRAQAPLVEVELIDISDSTITVTLRKKRDLKNGYLPKQWQGKPVTYQIAGKSLGL